MRTNNIVFIDGQVSSYESLIAGLGSDTDWYVLDTSLDGVEQMQRILANYSNLDAVQIVSHGSPGTLYLGSTVLNSDKLQAYQAPLQAIGAALSESGDLLLYGCNVAQGAVGVQFISALAQATGADVAASDDATGAAALGGDAVLEQATGPVEAPVLHGNGQGFTTLLAAPSFAANVDYTTGAYPLSVTSADVNGDGKADLIVANSSSYTVSVLTNNGDGTFAPKVDYATGMAPSSVTSADVNGDGKADLIVANRDSYTVSVLTNNGDGTFATKVDYATGPKPSSVTSADVNGDGKADLIVANSVSSSVSVLTNRGNGTFAAKVDYATGPKPSSVTSADVNGDGKADLIVANSMGSSVSVLTNNGNGTFAAKVDYGTGAGSPHSVTSADVNGDGKADLITGNSSTVSVLTNNGNGTFAPKVDYATGLNPYSVTSVDVNGDGTADLIAANSVSNNVSVLTNNGDGTFAPKIDYATSTYPLSLTTLSVTSADINGDGKADLITANSGSNTVSVLMNTSVTVAPTPTYSLTANAASYDEGSNALFTLTTTGVDNGTLLPYSLSGVGITAADITGGTLTGSVTVSNNTATLTLPLAADLTTEGSETLTVTIADVTASTVVADTSTGSNTNNHAPTGNVTVSGTAKQGQTLTANNTLSDADGLGTINYQWLADGVAISGATAKTLQLTQNQVGKAISVTASYTDGGGALESKTSSATSAILNVNDVPTGNVTISGTAEQGQTLIANHTLADVDGLGAISYQWKANGGAISEATTNTLTLTQAQVGKAITVTASYTDGGRTAESKTSSATTAVLNVNDPLTGDISISGTPRQGQTLTANNTLADADGLGTLQYQWLADGVTINGATSRTLALNQAHIGKNISVTISYTDRGGNLESKTSEATSIINNIDGVQPAKVRVIGSDFITAENGNSAEFLVQLDKKPSSNITIQFSLSDNTEATLPKTSLTFTPDNWDTDQSLIVVGKDDELEDGDISYQLKATVIGNDVLYKRVTIAPIELTNENDLLDAPLYLYGNSDNNALQGNNGADYLYGRSGNDQLNGGRGNDFLYGGSGNDDLDGQEGADKMYGGDGSDTYYVDNTKDIIVETATGGVDTVISTAKDYTLPNYVENGRIGTTAAANLNGNTLDNLFYAGAGDNIFKGVSGADTVSYLYGLVNDATAGVNISLAIGTAQTTGGSGKDTLRNIKNLTGSTLNDSLTGNNQNNVLDGGAGNDTLVGGLGKDTLIGGDGNDIFDFNNVNETGTTERTWDVITDFVSGQDKIDLSTIDANTTTTVNDDFNGTLIAATANFTAAGQLKLVVSNGNGVLYGNTDSDAQAEFSIQINGVTDLTAADLIL